MEYRANSKVDILTGQARLLFGSVYSAGVAHIGAAFIFYLLVVESVIAGYAALWFIVIVAIAVARMVISFRYKGDIGDRELGRCLKLYFVSVLLLGFAWGFVQILQFQLGDPDVRNFTFLVYLGLVAASVSTLSAWLPALFAFVIPQLIVLLVVMILVYSVLMLVLGKNINRNLIDSLNLKLVNLSLIENLNGEIHQRSQAQQQLERHQAELQKVVEERTQELVLINKNLQREIDDRQQAEESLRYAEQYDQLTGLPNRALLLDRIRHAISTSAREQWMVAVLFLGIDRSFVTGINNDDNLRKIVYAIIGMSRSLEIENVIEGVENREELATIQALGGNIIQGYFYSKPLKRGEELVKWLADN